MNSSEVGANLKSSKDIAVQATCEFYATTVLPLFKNPPYENILFIRPYLDTSRYDFQAWDTSLQEQPLD